MAATQAKQSETVKGDGSASNADVIAEMANESTAPNMNPSQLDGGPNKSRVRSRRVVVEKTRMQIDKNTGKNEKHKIVVEKWVYPDWKPVGNEKLIEG